MTCTHTFYLEVPDGDGWREDEFVVPFDVEPYRPGYTSGPPEKCYPPEGGYASGYGPVIWIHLGGQEEISWGQFLERWATARELTLEEAEVEVDGELYQAFVDREEGRRDDALEHIAEFARERAWMEERPW